MRLKDAIKPISHVKAHASEVIKTINETKQPLIITQNGEAKAVLQDIESYDNMQENLAFLSLVMQGRKDVQEGKIQPLEEAVDELQKRLGIEP